MRSDPSKISMVTSASQGIGAGIAAELRRPGYAVVATSRSIRASDHHDLLTVQGDITDAETAPRPVEQALERFAGRPCGPHQGRTGRSDASRATE